MNSIAQAAQRKLGKQGIASAYMRRLQPKATPTPAPRNPSRAEVYPNPNPYQQFGKNKMRGTVSPITQKMRDTLRENIGSRLQSLLGG